MKTQKPIELIDRSCAKRLVACNPPFCLLQRLLMQPKPMDAPFDDALNKPGLFQHLQML